MPHPRIPAIKDPTDKLLMIGQFGQVYDLAPCSVSGINQLMECVLYEFHSDTLSKLDSCLTVREYIKMKCRVDNPVNSNELGWQEVDFIEAKARCSFLRLCPNLNHEQLSEDCDVQS
jgi:hypothetical protein